MQIKSTLGGHPRVMVTCVYCHNLRSEELLWVQCQLCEEGVHVRCIPLKQIVYEEGTSTMSYPDKEEMIVAYTCKKHEAFGELIVKNDLFKKRKLQTPGDKKEHTKNYNLRKGKVLDYLSLNEGDHIKLRNIHPHLKSFLECFQKLENTINVIDSETFEKSFDNINVPYKISDPLNSGMRLPLPRDTGRNTLTVQDITDILGTDCQIDVMDVQTQQNERWSLSQWNEYFSNTSKDDRERLKNVISFEVSSFTNFFVSRPKAVEENDLVDTVWKKFGNPDLDGSKPKVTKYVLMSVANAFTDFHVDFAGTSVYYNVISGSKKFILFPPTEPNLQKYIDWCSLYNQSSVFLGDKLEDGVAMELFSGDLFMIPSGYIHVVYTPVDSLVIGGNFLTHRDLSTQLRIVDIERITKVPKRYTFPSFSKVMYKTCELLISEMEGDKEEFPSEQVINQIIAYIKASTVKYSSLQYPSKQALIKQLMASFKRQK